MHEKCMGCQARYHHQVLHHLMQLGTMEHNGTKGGVNIEQRTLCLAIQFQSAIKQGLIHALSMVLVSRCAIKEEGE